MKYRHTDTETPLILDLQVIVDSKFCKRCWFTMSSFIVSGLRPTIYHLKTPVYTPQPLGAKIQTLTADTDTLTSDEKKQNNWRCSHKLMSGMWNL